MSEVKEFVQVGKVKDAHGIRGELFVVLFAGEAEWLEKLKSLRLVRENGDQPPRELALKSARAHKNGFIAKTSDLRDRNAAEELKGWLLEIPDELLTSQPGEAIYLREILGFRVFTQEEGEVGSIVGFSHNVAQDLLIVKGPRGEHEIPFVEPFVERTDYEARELHMTLPPGLIGDLDSDEESAQASDEGEADEA